MCVGGEGSIDIRVICDSHRPVSWEGNIFLDSSGSVLLSARDVIQYRVCVCVNVCLYLYIYAKTIP